MRHNETRETGAEEKLTLSFADYLRNARVGLDRRQTWHVPCYILPAMTATSDNNKEGRMFEGNKLFCQKIRNGVFRPVAEPTATQVKALIDCGTMTTHKGGYYYSKSDRNIAHDPA